MDPRLTPLDGVLRLNTRLFHNCLDGLDDAMGRTRIDDRTNPASFIAVHLLDARAYLVGMLGGDRDHPYREELAGASHLDQVERLPPLDGVRESWDVVSRRLERALAEASPAALEAEVGQPFPVDDASLLGALAFLVQHESYHIGQLGLLRKHLGLPAMTYE